MKNSYRFLPIFMCLCTIFTASNLLAQDTTKPTAKTVLNKVELEKDAKKEASLHCELGKLELEEIELEDDAKRPALNAKIEAAGNALEKHAKMTGEKYANKAASDLFVKFFTAELKKCKTPRPE